MAGDPAVAMQYFDGMGAHSGVDALPGQSRGCAVEGSVHFDVVVDVDLAALEGHDLIRMRRQRFQLRLVESFDPVPSASVELFERASV